jgi:hypothetical protein
MAFILVAALIVSKENPNSAAAFDENVHSKSNKLKKRFYACCL